jgi:ABC-type multidrug transport system fused ATPase/permease subunit
MVLSVLISALAGPRQKVWLEAIEKRVDVTAKVLGSVNGVRTAGLTDKLYTLVQTMRTDEIAMSERFRRLLILVVGVAYSNVSLSPLASFIIYSLIARHNGDETLTPAKAFTSLTLFTLLATPISNLVEAATGVATAVGSIKRINLFLQSEPRHDDARESRAPQSNVSITSSITTSIPTTTQTEIGVISVKEKEKDPAFVQEFPSVSSRGGLPSYDGATGPAFVADGRSAGWEESKPTVIEDLSFKIHRGTVTIVVGPVGCGKSTLVRALLRETPIYSGGLKVEPEAIAYCSQTPWLTNSSLQDNILGESFFDVDWYNAVIEACALYDDIQSQPNGDQTMLGSQGTVLSGGQKQRVVSFYLLFTLALHLTNGTEF